MKVAFVHQPLGTLSPPVKHGSIGIWTYEVARRLAPSCNVIVYARRGPEQAEIKADGGVEYRRISSGLDDRALKLLGRHPRLQRLPGLRNPKRPFFASRFAHLEYGLRVATDLRAQQCDLVHIHNFSQLVPLIRAFNPKVRIVLHMHCEWLTQLEPRLVERRLRNCDLVLGCSEHIAGKIRRRFPQAASRCAVVYNGVDPQCFTPNGHGSIGERGVKRLLFVGRVSPEKGLHVLLQAFGKIFEQNPQTELRIVGPEWVPPLDFIVRFGEDERVADLARFYRGSYLSHLRQMLSPGVADRVSFLGNLPYPELAALYRAADVVINPSFVESFGMSLVEAMACKAAVVATRVGGVSEVVENGESGILVEAGNASALAQAVLRLLEDPNLRESMGAAGRRRVIERFSWERVVESLLSRYQESCLSRNRTSRWGRGGQN